MKLLFKHVSHDFRFLFIKASQKVIQIEGKWLHGLTKFAVLSLNITRHFAIPSGILEVCDESFPRQSFSSLEPPVPGLGREFSC